MLQVLQSLTALAPDLGHVVESHVFMDGGADGRALQPNALRLVHALIDVLRDPAHGCSPVRARVCVCVCVCVCLCLCASL
jgi:hypothetical protein